MALAAALVWEVRTDGSDNNGGGFTAGASGTDRSQQAAAHATLTTLSVVDAVTTVILVSLTDYTVVAADVGNVLQVTGGTATPGFYEITAVDTGLNTWTVDRSVGTAGQTVVGAMGGALLTPGTAAGATVASNIVWIKSGTYVLTTTSTNVSGGPVSLALTLQRWEGYSSTRGDLGTAPLIQVPGAGVTTITIFQHTGSGSLIRNLSVDGQSKTSIRGFSFDNASPAFGYLLSALNCTNSGINAGCLERCLVTNCTGGTGFSGPRVAVDCVLQDSTVIGFSSADGGSYLRCIADSTTNWGFRAVNVGVVYTDCVSYNNTVGFRVDQFAVFSNCIAEGNSGHGWGAGAARPTTAIYTSAGYNNTSGNVDTANLTGPVSVTALSGSPFTNAAGSDFSLNNTAGAGASCRAAGYPGVFPGGTTTGYLDIGAVQHQDAGGSSLTWTPLSVLGAAGAQLFRAVASGSGT